MFASEIKSGLKVTFKPAKNLDDEVKIHLPFMPSVCVVQRKLITLISGYRNYAASLLVKTIGANIKQPEGDPVISSFPKIIDCVDILDQICTLWNEDVHRLPKKSIGLIMDAAREFIGKIYPVLFTDGFKLTPMNQIESSLGDD